MRKILALLAVLLLLPGLAVTAKGTGEKTATAKEPIEIGMSEFQFMGDVSDWPDLKAEYLKEFEKKFGVRIKMNLIPRNNYMEKLYLMISTGELTGMIRVFGAQDVLKCIDDGTILPLDEYVKDNPVYQKEFVGYDNTMTSDGRTWGLFAGYARSGIFARMWRKDWLDKLGLKAPETVEELYTAAKLMTENDPDGNGKKDTVGLTSASGTWCIGDVFHAYDARLNDTQSNSITWDPVENAWGDSMLKPGMVDALKMMNALYKNGYLDNEFFTNKGSNMRDKIISGKYGSTYYWMHWGLRDAPPMIQKNVPTATTTAVAALKGTRTTLINHIVSNGVLHVLVKGTKNPKEVVNSFINLFYDNKDAHFWGRFGIEGKNWKWDGNKVVQMKDPKTGNLMPTSGLIDTHPKFGFAKYPVVPEGSADDQAKAIAMQNLMDKIMDDGLADQSLFNVTNLYDNPRSPKYNAIVADLERIFNEVIVKATTGELSPENAIKYYRDNMRKLGTAAAIEEMNAALGLATGRKADTKWKNY